MSGVEGPGPLDLLEATHCGWIRDVRWDLGSIPPLRKRVDTNEPRLANFDVGFLQRIDGRRGTGEGEGLLLAGGGALEELRTFCVS